MIPLITLFFLLLPTYLIRFNIGSLPTTLLEIIFWIICIVFIVKNIRQRRTRLGREKDLFSQHKSLFIAIALFLLAATISIFTSTNTRAALGEWKAFYVEPVILFFIVTITLQQMNMTERERAIKTVLLSLISLSLITSLFAIYQHFTGWLVPDAFWANRNTYRVTAWYGFPNAVGLFLAPVIPLALYLIRQSWEEIKKQRTMTIFFTLSMILSSLFAIIFAKSTGGLIGVAAGIGTLLLFSKKTCLPTIVVGIAALIGIFLLQTQNPIRQELFLQD